MSPEMNPFDQPLSSLSNIPRTKVNKEEKVETINTKREIFQEDMAWQKQLESEDPEFMKEVKVNLLKKITIVMDHLEIIINDPTSSPYEKAKAQEELGKRKTQYDRLNYKYNNND